MASSTTIPKTTMNANMEFMLRLISNRGRKRKEPKKEIGIPMVTQKASLGSRKIAKNANTAAFSHGCCISVGHRGIVDWVDSDGDGIGDTPYNITQSTYNSYVTNQDNFPLMECPLSFPVDNSEGLPIELIIIISVISGGALIGIATLLLIIRKKKRT